MPTSAFQNHEESQDRPFKLDIGPYSATYREGVSSGSSQHSEHFSASLGATVGNDFLSASVMGSYDHSTMQSQNASISSRHASVRAGRLHFDELPRLSVAARSALQSSSAEFHARFGDYFVAALELGADIGCSLSVSSKSHAETERTALTVAVHALFWDASATTENVSSSEYAELDLSFRSYNTSNNSNDTVHTSEPSGVALIRTYAKQYLRLTADLGPRFQIELDQSGLADQNASFGWLDCDKVVRAGLGVQYVLLPFATLPEVIELQALA
ncbi:hypothetical protein LTS10_008103 [Elasticomyces elasticus]|nr:hypothetical protein LTS10_008103 [Elasticomyces elasticus]